MKPLAEENRGRRCGLRNFGNEWSLRKKAKEKIYIRVALQLIKSFPMWHGLTVLILLCLLIDLKY